MASLYTNENFPQPAVAELRNRGHDVLTTHEAGNSNRSVSDLDVVRYATANGRVVVTLNRRDFIRIHQSGIPHAGIVVCTLDQNYAALASRIDHALATQTATANTLVRVDRGNGQVPTPVSRIAGGDSRG